MNDFEVDVVVVGAGPAGSIAARVLAEANLSVLVLEKRQEIGTPKRCAEGLNIAGLKQVGVEPNPKWAVNEIHGAVLYSPSGAQVRLKTEENMGFILERKVFEKHLAAQAITKGAKYMVKTTASKAIIMDGKVVGVEAEHFGEKFTVKAKLTIAADGVDSKIGRSAGLNTLNKLSDYHSGFQYEMANVNIEDGMLHIYFGDDVAPKGYVWIFPKGSNLSNVGIGILGQASEDGKRAQDYLNKFIDRHPEYFKDASPVEINTGGVPVSSCIDSFVTDGLMIVGDAAQQVNPIHGGGIALAMNAGKIAAEVAVDALKSNDVSKSKLSEYEKIWRETDGKRMGKLLRLRSFLEKLSNDDFERFAELLDGDDVRSLTAGDFKGFIKLLVKMPRLLPLAKKMLL